uniref:Caspase n=1 Tax=Marseillevirus LCMAC101 TaxID=2506602 RepID=A0A481YS39_9VIRU|nr:MAG: caspase [Marseillevirus LCMAC101]
MSKKALLIGINYTGTSSALNGCITDVANIKEYLIKKGYNDQNIKVLTDETELKPTRVNILTHLLELIVSNASTLFFHYSGHGSYVADEDGSEKDGKDECLVPVDYMYSGMILDDEIRGVLQCLNKGKNMTMILDCCHSGSGTDLRYNLYERQGTYKLIREPKLSNTRGNVIMISGAKDSQTASDAFINGKYQGALTNSFLYVLGRHNHLTYEELMRKLRAKLKKGRYSQIPCLSSGRSLRLNTQFTV